MTDKQIEDAAAQMMVNARKSLDKICLENGMTSEEIQKIVDEAMEATSINGVPIHATCCPTCKGKGWIK